MRRRKTYLIKLRRVQITCWCGLYDFPHRLGGGRCYGRDWAESYHTVICEQCLNCPANREARCDVAIGLEHINNCSGTGDYLHRGLKHRLPVYEIDVPQEDEIYCPF